MVRLVLALALFASPATAIAQSAAAPEKAPAVMTAWRFKDPHPPTRSRLRIEPRAERVKAIAERVEIRAKDQWVSSDGFRFTGSRIAYRGRF